MAARLQCGGMCQEEAMMDRHYIYDAESRKVRDLISASILITLILSTNGSAQQITFNQAVQEMLAKNPKFAQTKLESDASENQLDAVKSSYWPQLDFIQSWTYSNNPVYAFATLLNQQQFSANDFSIDKLNHPEVSSDVSSQFQLSWLIYDFGKRESRIDSAESLTRISKLQQDSTRLSLLQELVRRYYAVSLAAQRSDVANEALKSAESQLKQAKNRVSEGMVVRSDELTAEVFRASRLQEKIDAENQQKVAIAALNEILGRQNNEVVITADLKEQAFINEPLSFWQQEMKQNKPELRISVENSNLANSQVRANKSNFYPTVQAWSNYQWHGDDFNYTGDNWGVGVELHWNLFRGFADRKQLAEAKLLEQSSHEKERETKNALQLQLQRAYYDFQSAKEKLVVSSAMVAQAAESRRIYADRYSNGMVSIQDSLQAETSYKESRLMYAQNLYELYVAFAELLGAAGNADEIQNIGVQS
jgi:outer membrane protein